MFEKYNSSPLQQYKIKMLPTGEKPAGFYNIALYSLTMMSLISGKEEFFKCPEKSIQNR
jgi:hypothetical protein